MRHLRWEIRRMFEDGSYFVDGRFRTRAEAVAERARQKADLVGQPSWDPESKSFTGPPHTGEHYARFVRVMERKRGDHSRNLGHRI